MNKCTFLLLFLLLSCGRESTQEEEIFHLNEYIDEQYNILYHGVDSKFQFEGNMLLVGAGLHLKIKPRNVRSGHLFLILSSNPYCQSSEVYRPIWNLNTDFSSEMKFENGFNLSEGTIKKSFSYHQLMKFLRTPKKDFDYLGKGEKLFFPTRTLLFYYSTRSVIGEETPTFLGCGEFHST